MKTPNKPKSQTATLARKFKVTPRTVRNWRTEGAPLSDPVKLSTWLASRKHVPKNGTPASATTSPEPQDTSPLETGAAAALRRLEQAEASAYRRLEQTLTKGDAVEIRVARENWLKISNGLRLYEQAIDDHKRERGMLVEKSVVENALFWLGNSLRNISQSSLPNIVDAVRAEENIFRAREIVERIGWYNFMATASVGYARLLPEWILEAYCKDLNGYIKSEDGKTIAQQCKDMSQIFSEIAKANANLAISHTPPTPQPPKIGDHT